MKLSAVKAVLSTLLIPVFLVLVLSGALLYFGKTGVVWGMPRYMIRNAHTVAAVLMCVIVPTHFILNHRIYRAELRALQAKDNGGRSEDKQ